jgi:hypothetical protein
MIDTDDCWIFAGSVNDKGYGRVIHWYKGKAIQEYPHRLTYTKFKGVIPEGLVVDHLCRTPLCINPEHLEAVTNKENILRGIGYAGVNTRKTHCPRGHEYTRENTSRFGSKGWRRCKTCETERSRLYYLAHRVTK